MSTNRQTATVCGSWIGSSTEMTVGTVLISGSEVFTRERSDQVATAVLKLRLFWHPHSVSTL